METVIEAPEEISRESLIESAHKVDNENAQEEGYQSAQPEPERTTGEEQPKPEVKTGTTPESSETKPETPEAKAQRERDEKGRFKPKAEEQAAGETESKFEKAKKEQERQQTLLKNFQQEKERERAAIEAEKQQIAEEKQKLQQHYAAQRPEATKDGFTAREYFQAAQDFAKNGDFEAAFKAQAAGQEVRAYEARYFQQQSQQQSHKAYESAWQEQMNKSFKDDPDTDPNSNSKLSEVIKTVLNDYPESFYLKDGFPRIVKIAKSILDAGSVSELREQLKQAHTELEGLKKATTPARGGPSSPSSPKGFDQMSSADQREYLQRQAEELDSQASAA